ncbi:MAG TPA: hypothetical protein VHL09_07295 [Dehalococcoidia bacterium]|nr:hypothetical protein [Dehalococcoidia bacterium]
MMLVIMKGDFDRSAAPGSRGLDLSAMKVQYMAYVFELDDGRPIMQLYSPDGRLFKRALNDPSLPDHPVTPIGRMPTLESQGPTGFPPTGR